MNLEVFRPVGCYRQPRMDDENGLFVCDHILWGLREFPATDPRAHAYVGLAEDIQILDSVRRKELAKELFRVALATERDTPHREVAWVALRRWTSLVELGEFELLALFLAPGTEVETMQCAAQCVWRRLALEPSRPQFASLEARLAELLTKSIDVDWLSFHFAGSLTANLLLAYATLASDENLAAVVSRARALDFDCFPWQLVRSKVRRMQSHVSSHSLPSSCVNRLHLLLP